MLASTPLILSLIAPVILACKYITQLVKPYLELIVSNPTDTAARDYAKRKALHDNTIRLFVVLLGAALLPFVGYFGGSFFHATLLLTPESLVTAGLFGAAAGLMSLGDYHLIDLLQGTTPATPPATTPPPA